MLLVGSLHVAYDLTPETPTHIFCLPRVNAERFRGCSAVGVEALLAWSRLRDRCRSLAPSGRGLRLG